MIGGLLLSKYREEKNNKFSLDNNTLSNCKCSECPVQGFSACSTPYVQKTLNSQAEVYCFIGAAKCKDLDKSKNCICKQCKIYKDFNLALGKPSKYFCFNGKSKQ